MSTNVEIIEIVGKKGNQLDPISGAVPSNYLAYVVNPTTGQSFKVTQQQIRTFVGTAVVPGGEGVRIVVTAPTYADALNEASGSQYKEIKVLVDETDNGTTTNRYLYDGVPGVLDLIF